MQLNFTFVKQFSILIFKIILFVSIQHGSFIATFQDFSMADVQRMYIFRLSCILFHSLIIKSVHTEPVQRPL